VQVIKDYNDVGVTVLLASCTGVSPSLFHLPVLKP